MDANECQVHSLNTMHDPVRRADTAWQFANRLRRFAKRRVAFLANTASGVSATQSATVPALPGELATPFQAGDRVRVKSKEDIHKTLDAWNELSGCGFMEEMWQFCGTEQTVLKRVERFLDERDYRVKRVRGTVLLDGLLCEGTVDFGPCDRSCFFIWREEWLERA
jgi:hypothetical protein